MWFSLLMALDITICNFNHWLFSQLKRLGSVSCDNMRPINTFLFEWHWKKCKFFSWLTLKLIHICLVYWNWNTNSVSIARWTSEEEACAIFWLLQEISNSEVYHNGCGGWKWLLLGSQMPGHLARAWPSTSPSPLHYASISIEKLH